MFSSLGVVYVLSDIRQRRAISRESRVWFGENRCLALYNTPTYSGHNFPATSQEEVVPPAIRDNDNRYDIIEWPTFPPA